MGVEPAACLFCGRWKGDGLMVRGSFICSKCEKILLYLPVGTPAYNFCIERLKVLWAEG